MQSLNMASTTSQAYWLLFKHTEHILHNYLPIAVKYDAIWTKNIVIDRGDSLGQY